MQLTSEELNKRFKGKKVKLHGLHPGADSRPYKHNPGIFEGAHTNCSGFSACHYSFFIDYWRDGTSGELYGFYTANAHKDTEPGFVCIELAEDG
jgi:hypothetical protein